MQTYFQIHVFLCFMKFFKAHQSLLLKVQTNIAGTVKLRRPLRTIYRTINIFQKN